MLKGYYAEKILSGDKVTTIRPGRIEVKSREFLIHSGGRIIARAVLEDVKYKRLKDLTEIEAKEDGFSSVNELRRELRKFYPNLKEHDWVTIIKFRVLEKLDYPETYKYGGKTALEIAELALKHRDKLDLSEKELEILRLLIETQSLRAVAKKVFGNINARKKVRKVLWGIAKKLINEGILSNKYNLED